LNLSVTTDLLEKLEDPKSVADELVTRALDNGLNESQINSAMEELKDL